MDTLNRRNFITTSVAASSAALLSRTAFGQGDAVRTGIIGVGNRGAHLVKGILTEPDVQIIAICDTKSDRADKAATLAARDKPETYSDYRKLLENKDVQAVFIATPCDLHVEMAIAALQAGKHVYCEKPVGITPESIKQLLAVAKESKTVFQPGQQMRSDTQLQQSIAKIHEGIAGKVVMIKAARNAGDDLPYSLSSAEWFFNVKRSGDVIVEMAVHNLDVCNWAAGAHPERAAGFGGTLVYVDTPPGRTNMDGYTLTYEYTNGVKMSFAQTFFHPDKMPGGGQYFYVYGTEGAVDVRNGTYYPRKRGAEPVPLAPPAARAERDAHIAAFYESIRTGKKPAVDITVGATAALTAIMGREAIYNKRMVTWQELGVEV